MDSGTFKNLEGDRAKRMEGAQRARDQRTYQNRTQQSRPSSNMSRPSNMGSYRGGGGMSRGGGGRGGGGGRRR
jgi:hypothetical protein